jgi:hypothetical protein
MRASLREQRHAPASADRRHGGFVSLRRAQASPRTASACRTARRTRTRPPRFGRSDRQHRRRRSSGIPARPVATIEHPPSSSAPVRPPVPSRVEQTGGARVVVSKRRRSGRHERRQGDHEIGADIGCIENVRRVERRMAKLGRWRRAPARSGLRRMAGLPWPCRESRAVDLHRSG